MKTYNLVFLTGFLLCLAATLFASLMPGNGTTSLPYIDKVAHFIMHFTIMFNVVALLDKKKNIVIFVFLGILLGGILEFAQQYVPNRSFEYSDIVANSLGTIFGLICMTKLKPWFQKLMKDK